MKIAVQKIEKVFKRASRYSYYDFWSADLLQEIGFALSRNHCDLILHQQRIEYCAKQNNQPLLFTALVDLWTVVGTKAVPYKQRIYLRFQHLLSLEQKCVLKRGIESGLKPEAVINGLVQSLFNDGLEGTVMTDKHLDGLNF